jgi:hypothetical protein
MKIGRRAQAMRKLLMLSSVALVSLAVAGAALAAGPTITTTTISVTTPDPNEVNFSCRPYGYDFEVLSTFTVTRRSIQFSDDSGHLVKEIRHVDFTGTLYRSNDLSKTIPYAGSFTRTLDTIADTVTTSGLVRYSHPDGAGIVALAPGHVVVSASTFDLITEAGISGAVWEAGVCAYLATA